MTSNGPEDSAKWRRDVGAKKGFVVDICERCKQKIQLWHCGDKGCPWCAGCGTKAKDINGTGGK